MVEIRELILKYLIELESFSLRIIPFIKIDYFEINHHRNIVKYVLGYYSKYNGLPTYEVLDIYAQREKTYSDKDISDFRIFLHKIKVLSNDTDEKWLLDNTEIFFRRRAMFNALVESLDLYEKDIDMKIVPNLMLNALGVTLDNSIGHDYFSDVDKQFDYYISDCVKYPCSLNDMNLSTAGGFAKKTLNIFLGQPGVGKSQMLIQMATHYIQTGLNVVYVTLELSEQVVRQRCDANLLNITVNSLIKTDKDTFYTKFNSLKAKTHGNFIIKEYPTGAAGAINFRSLLNEIKIKKQFEPDILIVDYLGIAAPSTNTKGDLYITGKVVAQEMRALAVEYDIIVFSAAQTNREGDNSLTVGMRNVAESAATIHICDYAAAICTNPDMRDSGRVFINTLKNRLNRLEDNQTYNLGFDSSYMRFFDHNGLIHKIDDEYVNLLSDMTKTMRNVREYGKSLLPEMLSDDIFN